jgi:probable F420-dependent oxidoreductase
VPVIDEFNFIAPVPRLTGDGAAWVAKLRRIEELGFDTAVVSHHVTNGWQLAPIATMAFAAASTTRLRVMSLVIQNPFQHPALLAKEIATIDRLSGGRAGLGIGAGWVGDDYDALGLEFDPGRVRVDQLSEALAIIRDYFTKESVTFTGDHYRIENLEALPRCVQRPNPPILVGASGPRMLDVAARQADIVGVQPRTVSGRVDRNAVAGLAAGPIEDTIDRIRRSAASSGRATPRIQFSCLHVDVTDADGPPRQVSAWTDVVKAEAKLLGDSPAVLVGTAAECAAKVLECAERFGITDWHLGQDPEVAGLILERLRDVQPLTASATNTQSSAVGGS